MPTDPRSSTSPLASLEEALGYRFQDASGLERALTHSSFANESSAEVSDNEALEFLGDAVLSFLMAEILFRDTPTGEEGDMSRSKAFVVSDANLAQVGEGLALGGHLRLGIGEERSGGRSKASLLAGALEAIIAAVFLDGGTGAARALVRRLFLPQLRDAGPVPPSDPKTMLQELLQGEGRPAPRYEVVEAAGPDHQRRFRVRASISGRCYGEGEGGTKKAAEQEAARAALARLDGERPPQAPAREG